MVELLGHYLRSDQARSLADPIELTDGMGNRTISLVRGCLPACLTAAGLGPDPSVTLDGLDSSLSLSGLMAWRGQDTVETVVSLVRRLSEVREASVSTPTKRLRPLNH